ncbi:integral membrane protein [Aspergillus flavus]|uniref:Integral membrane protein n=2 Tax=Aspergillus subgen. Circumdati TaxID=2720871 RepID=A0A7U2MEE5_ASPFN|nr:integral membrane protein [Aspergillus flavus]
MTSPAEQMFLFGEIIDPGPISVLALFGYADLTAGSAIIFATITISAYIASDWKFLSPWISALLTAVVRPIRAVVVDTSWVLMQLAAVRSLDDVFTTLRNLEDGVKSRIVESRPSRSVCVVVNWYFPFNRPLATYTLAKAVPSRRAAKLQPAVSRVDSTGHETQLRGMPPTPREIDLWNMIDQCEGVIAKQKGLIIAKTEELRVVKQRMEDGWALVKKLSARQALIEETRPRETTVIVELRQELAVKKGQLIIAQGKLRHVQDDTTAKERSLCERVAQLEQQLAREREQAEADSLSEHRSLRAELQTRKDQLVTLEHRLAAAEARERQSRGHIDTEHQNLVIRNNELVAQNQELMAQCQASQTEHDRLELQVRDSSVAIQERDAALGRVILLETELVTTKSSAESVVRQAQESLAHAYKADVALRQSMPDLQHTCDLTLAQERATADQAQKRASDLTAEVNVLQGKIGMAMRDAQRSHNQAAAAERTIQILEHRLSRWEASHSSQEIPKRPSRDVGSISTALAQSQVTVSQQQTEINDLRRQLGEAKQGFLWPSEQVAQEGVQKLWEVLSNEKRARTEDNIRWSRKTRELEDECQKLRISLSNAAASTPVRR